MNTNKTVLSVVGAALSGALLGMLFAPDKGTKTREKIAKKTLDSKDQMRKNLNNLSNTVVDQYNTVKENGKELFANKKQEIKDEVIKTTKAV